MYFGVFWRAQITHPLDWVADISEANKSRIGQIKLKLPAWFNPVVILNVEIGHFCNMSNFNMGTTRQLRWRHIQGKNLKMNNNYCLQNLHLYISGFHHPIRLVVNRVAAHIYVAWKCFSHGHTGLKNYRQEILRTTCSQLQATLSQVREMSQSVTCHVDCSHSTQVHISSWIFELSKHVILFKKHDNHMNINHALDATFISCRENKLFKMISVSEYRYIQY